MWLKAIILFRNYTRDHRKWHNKNTKNVINKDILSNSPEVLETLDTHLIEDRSAEQDNVGNGALAVPAIMGEEKQPHKKLQHKGSASEAVKGTSGARREVGSARSRGYGSARRGRRCWCRRKRRTGRSRAHLMGNMVCLLRRLLFLQKLDFDQFIRYSFGLYNFYWIYYQHEANVYWV